MSKIVQTLILSSLFSISTYALDLNSTNEILEQATEATKELATQLEPIVYENIVEKEVIVEENNQTTTVKIENNEITDNSVESDNLVQIPVIIENIEVNKTNNIENQTIIEREIVPTEENLSTKVKIETTIIELNSTEEQTITQTPTIENNITEEKKEIKEKEIKEKEIVEKGDPRKGKNIFKYVLKDDCGMTAYKFAEKHTQEEWLEILEENKVKETIIENCPDVKNYYQDKWTDDLYQFFYEASNEDEIPEC